MDLEDFSGDRVVEALLAVISTPNEDEEIVNSCLESLGGIGPEMAGVKVILKASPISVHGESSRR